jgi:diguanylate cyclase (GGDEF)-like protein
VATRGRVALWFGVRYATPMLVLVALAASAQPFPLRNLAGILSAQVMLALVTHTVALRGPRAMEMAIWAGMLCDLGAIGALVAATGGAGGPLSFLFVLHALAAGILLSSRAGVRVLLLATAAIIAMDIVALNVPAAAEARLPDGLITVAVLWVIGGAATLFSTYNERELRRRNAELATIRQVTLDIEDTLSLEQIFGDLCRGVVAGFAFDAAAVLLRNGEGMRCVAAHGVTGSIEASIELRGRLAHALALAGPLVTSGDQARADGALLELLGPRGYLAVPIAEDGLLVVTRAGRKGRPGTLRTHEIDSLDRLAHHARLAVANARLLARVQEMAITDPLTGLANHGEMQRRLSFEAGRLERYATLRGKGHRLSLVLLDIDNFKSFNDRFGHQAGDAVLKGVSAALRGAVRTFDVVARYGGEEFAIILPETGIDGARDVAERIRRAVSAYPFATRAGEKPVRVTVSVGVATAPENGASPPRLIRSADGALYHAKRAGKNQVVHAADLNETGATVLPIDPTRRRPARAEDPAPAGSRRARARSSRPTRRTPRA